MEEEISNRCDAYAWDHIELDRRAKLEYDAYVIDAVRFNGKDKNQFPSWNDLSESGKLFYRHRAVRDI